MSRKWQGNYTELQDGWPCLTCGDCIFFKVDADIKGRESTCKRLDHKHFQFRHFIFGSQDCGQHLQNGVCRDFKPKKCRVWLYEHWTSFDDYFSGFYRIPENAELKLIIDGNNEISYSVNRLEFINNKFINPDGTLRWIYKTYYKRFRNAKWFHYRLLNEYPDGKIFENSTPESIEHKKEWLKNNERHTFQG